MGGERGRHFKTLLEEEEVEEEWEWEEEEEMESLRMYDVGVDDGGGEICGSIVLDQDLTV